jgi:hypothetical protein
MVFGFDREDFRCFVAVTTPDHQRFAIDLFEVLLFS